MTSLTASMDHALRGLTGPFIIGTAISTFLSGVTIAQVYTYFSTFKTDRPVYRVTVIGLFTLDIVHTAFSQVTLWRWFVTQYGNPMAVMMAPWSFAVSPVICGTAALVVQIFYAHRLIMTSDTHTPIRRVYLLSNRNPIIPGLIVFGALFQFVWSDAATGKVFMIKYFEGFQVWTYGVSCWLCAAAITELLITASLVWILLHSKRGISRTNSIIDGLIALTIETNGLTFTVAVLDLILFATFKDASHVGPHLCLVKLYINSYLVSLNCRDKLAGQFGGSKTIHTSTSLNGQQPTTEEVSENRRGIRVLTTATLSTELLSTNYINNAKNDSNHNGIDFDQHCMRLDRLNTFTTNIVGRVDCNNTDNGRSDTY